MRNFEYREPRFAADIPVWFIQKDKTSAGRCREISKQGATLELDGPVEAGADGIISLSFQNDTVDVRAKVAHAEGCGGGFNFIYEGHSDRVAIAKVIAALATPIRRLGVWVFHATDR